jgi:hypothetical protein
MEAAAEGGGEVAGGEGGGAGRGEGVEEVAGACRAGLHVVDLEGTVVGEAQVKPTALVRDAAEGGLKATEAALRHGGEVEERLEGEGGGVGKARWAPRMADADGGAVEGREGGGGSVADGDLGALAEEGVVANGEGRHG